MLSGIIVHKPARSFIGVEITTARRRFTISGGLKPWSKSTVTIDPVGGWYFNAMLPCDLLAAIMPKFRCNEFYRDS